MNKYKIYPVFGMFLALLLFFPMCIKPREIKEDRDNNNTLSTGETAETHSSPGEEKQYDLLSPDSPTAPPEKPEQEGTNKDFTVRFPGALTNREEVAAWVQDNFTSYFQKYNLSCEAAIIRLVTGIWGIDNLSEDDILGIMPTHPSNPELGLVMENIRGDVYRPDKSINWANYGAHPPVVKKTLETILREKNLDALYRIDQQKLTDKELIDLLKINTECLGAIIWVAAYIDKEKPPVNEIGQVLGEHVQFVSPILSKGGRMLVYDVWPWDNQPFHLFVPFNRDMFNYETLLIMKKK